MQNKFGMNKIQGSGYMYYSLSEYISKKVTDYLYVKGIGCVFKQKKYIMDENKPLSE